MENGYQEVVTDVTSGKWMLGVRKWMYEVANEYQEVVNGGE